MANGVCVMHGGKSAIGVNHPSFLHGRYSKDIPVRLAARAEEVENDPRILNLRGEIGITEARLVDLLKRVDSGESGEAWKMAKNALDDFRKASREHDTVKAAEAMNELSQVVSRGLSDYAAWHEVGRQLDRKQRLVESERKYLIEQKQSLSLPDAMLLIQAIAAAALRTITDKEILGAFYGELRQLLSQHGVPIDVTPGAGDTTGGATAQLLEQSA